MRIGFSIVALCNLLLLWPLRDVLFAANGSVDLHAAVEHSGIGTVLLLQLFRTPLAVSLLMGVVAVALLMLMLGILPRFAAAVVFLWQLSYIERAPVALTGWDMVLNSFGFLILVSPMGTRWTLPGLWRSGESPCRQLPRYGLVLMRLQVLAIYVQSVVTKVSDPDPFWRNGEFLSYFLMSHFARWPAPWPAEYADLLRLLTWFVLVIELAIPILLFVRRTHRLGIALGLLLHAGISLMARNLEPFLAAMMMSYLAFLTDEDLAACERVNRRMRSWFSRRPEEGQRPADKPAQGNVSRPFS